MIARSSRRLQRWVLGVVVLAVGCGVEDGIQIEILNALSPTDGTCVFGTENNSIADGTWDPAVDNSPGHVLAFTIRNNLSAPPDGADPSAPGVPRTNVLIRGYDACLYRANDPSLGLGGIGEKSSPLVDCATLPANRAGFIPSSGSLPASGIAVGVVTYPSRTTLQALYGETFVPTNILVGDDPINLPRDDDWGNFPAAETDVVVVQLRVVGAKPDGAQVLSSWFSFPITVAVGRYSWLNFTCPAGEVLNDREKCLPYQGFDTISVQDCVDPNAT